MAAAGRRSTRLTAVTSVRPAAGGSILRPHPRRWLAAAYPMPAWARLQIAARSRSEEPVAGAADVPRRIPALAAAWDGPLRPAAPDPCTSPAAAAEAARGT